jgi:hypothetical protein
MLNHRVSWGELFFSASLFVKVLKNISPVLLKYTESRIMIT